jgi:hypothetical protein
MEPAMAKEVPCPFVYANGRKCPGHIIYVQAYKADVTWKSDEDGKWWPSVEQPRSHFHLVCSAKGGHGRREGEDSERMKFYLGKLPEGIDLMFGCPIEARPTA